MHHTIFESIYIWIINKTYTFFVFIYYLVGGAFHSFPRILIPFSSIAEHLQPIYGHIYYFRCMLLSSYHMLMLSQLLLISSFYHFYQGLCDDTA